MMTSQQALVLVQKILDFWAENDLFTKEHTFINEYGEIEIISISLGGRCIGALSNKFKYINVTTSFQFPDHIKVVCSL